MNSTRSCKNRSDAGWYRIVNACKIAQDRKRNFVIFVKRMGGEVEDGRGWCGICRVNIGPWTLGLEDSIVQRWERSRCVVVIMLGSVEYLTSAVHQYPSTR